MQNQLLKPSTLCFESLLRYLMFRLSRNININNMDTIDFTTKQLHEQTRGFILPDKRVTLTDKTIAQLAARNITFSLDKKKRFQERLCFNCLGPHQVKIAHQIIRAIHLNSSIILPYTTISNSSKSPMSSNSLDELKPEVTI